MSGAEQAKIECGDHTPCPAGYMEWHYWAKEMTDTHKQLACPDCGLYKIWVPK